MSANMTAFMEKTKNDDDNISEQVRLEDQHETVIAAMGGKLVYAPIDITTGGLRILDSACANGSKKSSSTSKTYVGTDVVESLYPNPPPEGTHFQNQSIKEPFPGAWEGTFDLVHQRLVMAAAAPEQTPGFVVQNLAKLLKPGGWLQLVEVITTPVPENPLSQNQYIDMLNTLYKNLYIDTKYAKSNLMAGLPQDMIDCGLRNVQQAEVLVKYGAAAEPPTIKEKSLRTAVAGVPNFLTVLKGMPNHLWKDEWNNLPERLHMELKENGGYMKYIVCWGQKRSAAAQSLLSSVPR